MSKKSFKPTPIPYRTKAGESMRYYVLSEDGKQETEVTRAECLARTEIPDGELPQRWFVDEESGMVVRLPRNQEGEDLARENMRFIWREAKHIERNFSCVYKGTDKCKGWKPDVDGLVKCDWCQLPNRSRTVELDMHFQREDGGDGDSPKPQFELVDPQDVQALVEEKAVIDTLYAALALYVQEEVGLLRDIFWHGKSERELAPLFGYKQPKSINKRKHKTLKSLSNNEALKRFFE